MIEALFYYDGELTPDKIPEGFSFIDAKYGITKSIKKFKRLLACGHDIKVITNEITLMNPRYCWDYEKHKSYAYFYIPEDKCWKSVYKLTRSVINTQANIAFKYINGELTNNLKPVWREPEES